MVPPNGYARLSIRDSDGNLRCSLSLNNAGQANLQLLNTRGDRQISSLVSKDGPLGFSFGSSAEGGPAIRFVCSASGVPTLGFDGGNGKGRVLLDGCSKRPSLIFAGSDQVTRLTLGLSADDKPMVSLRDGKRLGAMLSCDNDASYLKFNDMNGCDRMVFGIVRDAPSANFNDGHSKPRIFMGLSDKDEPAIALIDALGKVLTRIPAQ